MSRRNRPTDLAAAFAILIALALAGCAVEVKHEEGKGAKHGVRLGTAKEESAAPARVELPDEAVRVGEPLVAEGRVTLAQVREDPSPWLEKTVLVEAEAENVCQNAGCWMTVSDGKGEPIFVTWSSGCGGKYAFPKDAGGHRVLVQGTLVEKEISDEAAEHIAGESDGLEADDIRGKTFEISATSFAMLPRKES